MKSLAYGGAAAALLMGLAVQAHAQSVVRDAPVHAVPVDEDDAPSVARADVAPPPAKAEPAPVRALAQVPPSAPELTPEENAFFSALGQRVTDAASAYESYVRRAGGIDPAFDGAASVRRAVKVGAAYHPRQLEEGIVAYAALVALRDQAFVDGVRAIQNPSFADGLAAHPEQVMQVRGAGAAAADVAGVLKAQGEALIVAGASVTKAAYDIQAQSWSRSPVADPRGVLDAAKTSADQMRVATAPSKAKLLDSLVTAPQSAGTAQGSAAPEVVRGLALAALAVLGRTGDGMEAQYEALLHDISSADCLKMAKLNLNQCLAVAGPNYEDVYCAGRHAVSDTGKCIAQAADGGSALDGAPGPRLQEAEGMGREQAFVYGKAAPAAEADDDDDVAQPAPAVTPAPRQYAQAPQAPPTPAPRAQAPAYPQQRPSNYAQNDYAQNSYAPAPAQATPYAGQSYPAYAQPQYQTYQQPYQQPQYAPQQQPYPQAYAAQPYARPQASYAPSYGGQPYSYYPQQQGYPPYQGSYYGR